MSCNLRFVSNQVLGYHTKKIHSSYLTYCKLCCTDFKHGYKFQAHKKKFHTSKEELQAFNIKLEAQSLKETCNFCKKNFLNKNVLKYHLTFQHKEERKKDILCEYCNKAFPFSYNRKAKLETHMRSVHNLMNYSIDGFGKTETKTNMTVENFMNFFNSLTK